MDFFLSFDFITKNHYSVYIFIFLHEIMFLSLCYDLEASQLAEKIVFFDSSYVLCRQDIVDLKKKKLITYIDENDLPETLPCQILVSLEDSSKAKMMIFNPDYILSASVFDNAFLNKELIEWHYTHGWFWIDFTISLYDKDFKLHFEYSL